MKLKAIIVVEWEVTDLQHYSANTIQEAAELTQKQWDDCEIAVEDLTAFGTIVSVEVKPA